MGRVNRRAGRPAPLITAVLALLGLVLASLPARAATEVLYVQPTGHYVRGVFRDFWDRNGGLPNFGYPITEEYLDPASGRVYQFFERARFERANAGATSVELTPLGRIFIGPRSFPTAEPIENSDQRRYFPETRHIVQYGFKQIWETRGGQAIFGLPLSEELQEQLPDGQVRTVQYFENARFQFHPDQPDGQRVVISDLGRLFAPASLLPPLPPNSPPPGPISLTAPSAQPTAPPATPTAAPGQRTATPTARPPAPTATAVPPTPVPTAAPSLVRPNVPASRNARVLPQAGLQGQVFVLDANGFRPDEKVAVWLNVPDGSLREYPSQIDADSRGSIAYARLEFPSEIDAPLGVWSFVAQGVESGRQAVGYFLVLDALIGRAPPPGQGVPPNVNARAEPGAGPIGTIFVLSDASGFRANEEVQIAVVASDGAQVRAGFTVPADSRGSIAYAGVYFLAPEGAPLGLYSFVATGRSSGATARAYFVLTP